MTYYGDSGKGARMKILASLDAKAGITDEKLEDAETTPVAHN